VSTWAYSARPAPLLGRARAIGWSGWLRTLAPASLIAAVLAAHAWNMLHFPYLEDDEGTYFSQGWAVLHLGRLAPYTYFYDHAPLGWIQIAASQLLSGDGHFGYALASGRVLMLLYQAGSVLLVFTIARRVSGSGWVALLAVAIFGFSAYGIFYHRRVLLDNIAAFWILLSLYFLVGRVTLARVWLSAIALAIAVLSKEPAIAVAPALLVLVWRIAPDSSRRFAVIGWFAIAASLLSLYPLMALLKGELFPPGSALGSSHPHVSLLCALEFQSSRSADGGILQSSSQFWHSVSAWSYKEPLLVLGGTAAAIAGISLLRRHVVISMIGWMVLSLWLFLGRGGLVLDFYLVPLLPLLALSFALAAGELVSALRQRLPRRPGRLLAAGTVALLGLGCSACVALGYERSSHSLFTADPVAAQVDAVQWVRTHIPPKSNIIIDMYMFADLHYPPGGAPAFPHAEYYWKVADDPQISRGLLHDNWRNVSYVVTTPQLTYDASVNGFPIVVPALEHSAVVARFNTGGWDVEVRRVGPQITNSSFGRVRPQALSRCMSET
jgi:Dolichyl-phosphate-mannose-protein mannosyltransferase